MTWIVSLLLASLGVNACLFSLWYRQRTRHVRGLSLFSFPIAESGGVETIPTASKLIPNRYDGGDSLALLRAALDPLPVGVLFLNKERVILYANEHALNIVEKLAQWLSINPQDIVGTSYDQFCPNLAVEAPTLFQEPACQPYQASIDIGSEILESCVVPRHDGRGHIGGALVIWRCITEAYNQHLWLQLIEEQITTTSRKLTTNADNLQQSYHLMKELAGQTAKRTNDLSQFARQVMEHLHNYEQSQFSVQTIAEKVTHSTAIARQALAESQETAEIISVLNDVTGRIGEMVKRIEDVMRQTRVLAINATIEAARAGHEGRGFSVIAKEVGQLSQQTASVANEISTQIHDMLAAIPRAVTGIDAVEGVIRQMTTITLEMKSAVDDQADAMDQMTTHLQQANRQSQQIMEHVEDVAVLSTRTEAEVEKGAEATREMNHVADTYCIIVKRFNRDTVVTPNDVFRLMVILNRLFDALLAHYFRETTIPEQIATMKPQTFTDKKPKDVLGKTQSVAQTFLDFMQLPKEAIAFPNGTVTPTQVYRFVEHFVSVCEQALVRLGLETDELRSAPPVDGKTPNDVFGQIELASRKLALCQRA